MSTLQVGLPASQMPKTSLFGRVVAVFNAAVEIYVEAQKRANEMQRKYPFIGE